MKDKFVLADAYVAVSPQGTVINETTAFTIKDVKKILCNHYNWCWYKKFGWTIQKTKSFKLTNLKK